MRNKYTNLWIWMCLCPLALDYKAPNTQGDHFAQLVLVIPSVAAGAALALIAPRFREASRMRAWVNFALMLSVPGSIVAQFVQGNEFGNYLRVLLPFLLFQLGYIVACHPWHAERVTQFEKAMFWANVVSLIFTLIFGFATGGGLGGVEDVRYRIVSVTLLGLQGVLLHEFVVARRFSALTVSVFLLTLAIELLSVTRSLLVGTAALFILAAWMSAPTAQHMVRAGVRIIAVSAAIGSLVVAAAWMFPSVSEHWTQRFFAANETISGKDPTTITRLAEMQDQYDQVTSSVPSLLFGEGYGHYYRYSPVYLPDLAGQISEKDFYAIHEYAAGHNFWVYQLFAGGLLFGIALPLAVIIVLYRCCIRYRRWRVFAPNAPMLPPFGRAILLLAALPATSIGGNPLGPRFSGLIFGVALGLAVSIYAQLQGSPKLARRGAMEPSLRPAPRTTPPRPAIEPAQSPIPGLPMRCELPAVSIDAQAATLWNRRAEQVTRAQ